MALRRTTRPNTKDTDVSVSRVYDGDNYVRVNTVGAVGTRPFVLVPGIGVASTYFERLAPNLNEFGPVHALDLPGFGGVPHPDSAMSIESYATLLGKVIDELELDDPVLVGHSMGTQVVTELASRRPELSTVVLIGPVVNPLERHVLTQGRRFAQAAWHEPSKVKALAIGSYLLCGFKWFSRILPKMMSYPIEKRLPLVQARTLVIRGEFDAVAPREWIEEIGRLMPRSRLWEIPDAAHSVMHDHAAEVALLCVAHAKNPITTEEEAEQQAAASARDDSMLKVCEEKVHDELLAVARDDDDDSEGKGDDDSEGKADDADEADEADDADDADRADDVSESGDDSPSPSDPETEDSDSDNQAEGDDTPLSDVDIALKAVRGRMTETVGIFTDDDTAIAEGKTMHSEAMKAADEKNNNEGDGPLGSGEQQVPGKKDDHD